MRNLLIVIFLVTSSCKSEPRDANRIDPSVFKLWNDFTASNNPEHKKSELPESWFFHDNKADADRLAELTLSGKKKASSGLYFWYETANADLPKVGTKHIITDFDGKAKAIIQITKVDTIPFHEISDEYAAMDMGTTIEPLKKWKKAHWDFLANTLKESAQEPTEEMLVVCEQFETIWPK